MSNYDFLIVGAGLFGATFAHLAKASGKKVLVIDKRNHIAGNCYTENIEDISVHKYGAHIFHTSNKQVWDFVNSFAKFNRYTNSPLAMSKGKLYNLPFNMNTFYQLWGVKDPKDAQRIIKEQSAKENITQPQNLEEQALNLVGRDIYETLIKGYTEKQWGRDCKNLPAEIIKRLPLRFTFDNNYFNDCYQGIPSNGYTELVKNMLDKIEVRLGIDFLLNKAELTNLADKIIYTGAIDELFEYKLGKLEYRSLRFSTEVLNISNFQGNAVVNYIDKDIPYTRIIEHKHFDFGQQEKTVITKEYPDTWNISKERFYPINDYRNNKLYTEYTMLACNEKNIIFGGRLAEYKYYDMDDVIESAMNSFKKEST